VEYSVTFDANFSSLGWGTVLEPHSLTQAMNAHVRRPMCTLTQRSLSWPKREVFGYTRP
jgi:hypothetical protein